MFPLYPHPQNVPHGAFGIQLPKQVQPNDGKYGGKNGKNGGKNGKNGKNGGKNGK